MKIAVIGTGYVGLVAGTCFAESGNDVTCIDTDESKITLLEAGKIPIYEPGLEEMVQRNAKDGRLSFTTDFEKPVSEALVAFIAVGTPPAEDGSPDTSFLMAAAKQIARAMKGYTIIVIKSTVPVGTADKIRKAVAEEADFEFDVISNPEFLKEGTAVDDFMKPDRVVIGHGEIRAAEFMKELYSPFTRTGAPILFMDNRSAELAKYAANAMLATRVSFMNEIANVCESVDADVQNVRQAMGLDRRIGPTFLFPGLGYGGSCFPKDVKALIKLARDHSCDVDLVSAVEKVNEKQKQLLVRKILSYYAPSSEVPAGQLLAGKTFAVWGLSFKPRTDDMREAPSVVVISKLLEMGARVSAYDPVAMGEARNIFGERVAFNEDNYEVLRDADALLLITEWNLFRNPDFERMNRLMKQPVIFDGRNQYNPEEMSRIGFTYFGIGRGAASYQR